MSEATRHQIDWAGRAVEAASGQPLDSHHHDHIFAPLQMADSGFELFTARRERLMPVRRRKPDASLEPIVVDIPPAKPEFWDGGGALFSTRPDYLSFLRMFVGNGRFDGARVLRPEIVMEMSRNPVADLTAGIMRTAIPERTKDFRPLPRGLMLLGLGYMINTLPAPGDRGAGSLSWGCIFDTYYWIDPAKGSRP